MATRSAPSRPEPHHDHAVQFYRDDAALLATLSRFTREGLNARQPIIIIATPEHRDALARQLVKDGIARNHFERQGALWMLDARETLATFMDGPLPNATRFHDVIGGLIQQARAAADGAAIRAYGEMVDLLWKDGNPDAAIRLECLWNTLANVHQFMLLCGYSIGSFYKEAGGFDIGDVCQVHSRVLPA
jgi:hypothetical protein